ncbi:hypothetical protein MJO28_016418 [Puccinia striiformis f. sp. tritici]|uniref:Uncharacterized protein n=1 Tax=Puccinia striiformis f. sp. tritici TaxID=168172 RepID=A0ACC0DN65_9BASI|nr:hypothetical protein Pst134EA_030463 [Puccinia striiformis f. sp. tritici]KAH9446551.1 hypothetical protein Pst134EA_030463 [Puccinia striiformis f. sp. tritici]KAI7934950.1 hypothetical protein MJO29_016213 [Puccinia striiformis f. sp. tritici]KAI7935547.1 hypothetical protein MJO28_016418 [Puccinia striiformis f. sp. tritici]
MIAILFKSCLISLLVSPGLLALPVFQPEKPIRTCDGEEFPDLNKPYEHVGGISLGHFHPRETASCSRLSNPNHPIAGGSGIRISPQEATPGGDNPFWSRKRPAHDQPATRKSKCLKYTQDGAPESTRAQQFGTQEGEPKASKNSDVDLVTTQCVTDVSQAGILGSPEKGNHQERPPHLDVYNWNLVEIQVTDSIGFQPLTKSFAKLSKGLIEANSVFTWNVDQIQTADARNFKVSYNTFPMKNLPLMNTPPSPQISCVSLNPIFN